MIRSREALLVVCLVSGCNFVFGVDETKLANRNPRTLVFDNAASATDLLDLRVLVQLNPARIEYDQVTDPTTQLRFHDPVSEQDLPFEIDHWESGGDSALWLLVPRIPARSTDTVIEMHFGAAAAGTETPAAVWPGYAFVVHGGSRGFASSVGAYTARPDGATLTAGVVGNSLTFTADAHEVEFGGTEAMLSGWPTFSLDYWIYPTNNQYGEILAKDGPINIPRLEPWPAAPYPPLPSVVYHQIDMNFAGCETQHLNTLLPVAAWSHIAWAYDGQALWLYRNGAIDNVGGCNAPAPLPSSSSPLRLGAANNTFRGKLDEVRIGMTYRDADWIRAQYLSMTGVLVRFPEPGELTSR